MQPVLLGLFRVLCSSLTASCLHAPISWSPDGAWLAYTMVEPAEPAAIAPGRLSENAPPGEAGAEANRAQARRLAVDSVRYRIWAIERGSLATVLIEDSPYPLSSPAWGPEGRSLVYSRFVPDPPAPRGSLIRGRYELVVQESLDRKRVIPLLPELDLEADDVASLVELKGAWSPDGRFIVVGRPGRIPALLVVSSEPGRVVKTLERASHPAWSPDGARLAVLRLGRDPSSGWTLQIIARDFGGGRSLLDLAEPFDQPVWSPDGQSILVVGKRSRLQPREIELMRVLLDSGLASRAFHLGSSRPDESAHRFSIGFDREQEQCVFSADDGGSVSALAFASILRQQTLKRFHPLDVTLRMGSLTLDPEGQLVAVRIETDGHLAPPLLCNPMSEAVTLLAPDPVIRREWLATLVATSRELLQTALPAPVLDGRPITRQGMLPIPGEIPDQNPVLARLRHLGKIGREFLDQPPGDASSSVGDEPAAESVDEFRLCFDYLRGDFAAALADLDLLEARPESREGRLLPLRAQILQAQGESARARAIADYLLKSRGAKRLVEDTPAGLVFSSAEDPAHLWQRYLAQRLAMVPSPSVSGPGEPQVEGDPIRLLVPNLLEGLNRGEIGGGARFPFPNRPPVPGGPGAGRFGGPGGRQFGPGDGRFGGAPFGPRVMQPGRFPPPPPRPVVPGGQFQPRRRRNAQPGFPMDRPPGAQ